MKNIFVILLAIIIIVPISAFSQKNKANKETEQWRYETEDLGVIGQQGTSVFKVWTYSKKETIAITQASKNAVHAILFKGYGSNKPLVRDASIMESREDFFKDFFRDGGDFQRFVQLSNNGAISAGDRVKVGKEYKIGLKVIVRKDDLRKYLEEKGIIKAMNSMF